MCQATLSIRRNIVMLICRKHSIWPHLLTLIKKQRRDLAQESVAAQNRQNRHTYFIEANKLAQALISSNL